MSNCIEVLSDIVIPVSQINTINLFHDMEEINGLSSVDDDHSLKDYIIWWFLSKDNVFVEGDDLIIQLGRHRSSHTQRDFKQVGFVLAEYIAPMKEGDYIHCPVELQDECDGFTTIFKDELILKKFE